MALPVGGGRGEDRGSPAAGKPFQAERGTQGGGVGEQGLGLGADSWKG